MLSIVSNRIWNLTIAEKCNSSITKYKFQRFYVSKPNHYTKVIVAGDNVDGQCGVEEPICEKPTEIQGLPPIASVVAGEMHSLFLDVKGHVWSCGSSSFGQTGHGVDNECIFPKMLHIDDKIVAAAAGRTHSLLLTAAGEVYSFGEGSSSQLGYPSNINTDMIPKKIPALKGVFIEKIFCGAAHNLAIDEDGTSYIWGSGMMGQLGLNIDDNLWTPTPLQFFENDKIELVSLGATHSVVVTKNQQVYAWGSNKEGALARPNVRPHIHPKPTLISSYGANGNKDMELSFGEKWIHLSGGISHNVLISNKGKCLTWGRNANGCLANAIEPNLKTEKPMLIDSKFLNSRQVLMLTSGAYHNFALNSDNILVGWGQGTDFQFGNESRRNLDTPRQLHGILQSNLDEEEKEDLICNQEQNDTLPGEPVGSDWMTTGGWRLKQMSAGWSHSLFLLESTSYDVNKNSL